MIEKISLKAIKKITQNIEQRLRKINELSTLNNYRFNDKVSNKKNKNY